MTFVHSPHPHIAARSGPPKARHVQSSLSDRIGMKITAAVGTMACAAFFTVLALISLPAALSSANVVIIVAWIAQTFLQLVLLSIILVGSNVSAKASDARADATYKDATATLHEAQEIQRHLEHQDVVLGALIEKLKAKS